MAEAIFTSLLKRGKEAGSKPKAEPSEPPSSGDPADVTDGATAHSDPSESDRHHGPPRNDPPQDEGQEKRPVKRPLPSPKDGLPWGPHQVWYKGKARRLVDGLVNNSPGIRPVGHRHPPLTVEGQRLADRFWRMVTSFVDGLDKKHRLISELTLGKHSSSPFSQQADLMRAELDELVSALGQDPKRRPGDVSTEVGFRRVRAWAFLLEDADYRFLDDMAGTGVPVGVLGEIPWVEAVYDKKDKKSGPEALPQEQLPVGQKPHGKGERACLGGREQRLDEKNDIRGGTGSLQGGASSGFFGGGPEGS